MARNNNGRICDLSLDYFKIINMNYEIRQDNFPYKSETD